MIVMKKSELVKELEKSGINYKYLKKEFNVKLKKGEPLINQLLSQVSKKLNNCKSELMQIISPKNIIENHESKMISSGLKEDIYENIKELYLLSWKIKRAMLDNEEDKINAIKSSVDYMQKIYIPMKKNLCNEMIKNWKKEEIKNTNYIS
jgi:alpha-galactosidase/6-phospho-beta-glucosidase family protein